ncbi:signal peptidase I [Aneurinibacillus soli]|uniref:Signal peptidase I n=1 Tax=Aneurinibacillus soli TaxID=1500254 RepID=A0A0U5AV04_9BACL|nr:signal peptidase I [Aneurinibacillus soli]PYE63489.1 signal peptidase I [Aneurinibacillus soli]BAU27578.1 Signal peptidase I T [Aneurinibacillus soli]
MTEQSSPNGEKKNEAWEWIKALGIAIILALIIRSFLFAPFLVDGSSMMPTLENGERLIVNKLVYHLNGPKRGEIVVFHASATKDYIKRVIATEGETVEMKNDQLYINDKPVDEPYLAQYKLQAKQQGYKLTDDFPKQKIPAGHVFVMGDNRQNSQDSRIIGPVAIKEMVGRSEVVIWPYTKIRFH